jgi:hypothetical protein
MRHHPWAPAWGDEVLNDDRSAQLIHDRWRDTEKLGELARSWRRRPLVDGCGTLFLVATADVVVGDLLLPGALDGRIAIGSMNRGGLAAAKA